MILEFSIFPRFFFSISSFWLIEFKSLEIPFRLWFSSSVFRRLRFVSVQQFGQKEIKNILVHIWNNF